MSLMLRCPNCGQDSISWDARCRQYLCHYGICHASFSEFEWPSTGNLSAAARTDPAMLRAADKLAIAAFDLIERGIIATRTHLSDELERYADTRFNVMDGSGISRLRELAKATGFEVRT